MKIISFFLMLGLAVPSIQYGTTVSSSITMETSLAEKIIQLAHPDLEPVTGLSLSELLYQYEIGAVTITQTGDQTYEVAIGGNVAIVVLADTL